MGRPRPCFQGLMEMGWDAPKEERGSWAGSEDQKLAGRGLAVPAGTKQAVGRGTHPQASGLSWSWEAALIFCSICAR